MAELQRHQAPVNALAWAPHSSCHICSAGDDAQALIWDLSTMSHPMDHGLGAAHKLSRTSHPANTAVCSCVTLANGSFCLQLMLYFSQRCCTLLRACSSSLLIQNELADWMTERKRACPTFLHNEKQHCYL